MTKIIEGYKETEIGVIPEDWEVKKLAEIIKITSGNSLSQKNVVEGIYPVYGGNGINAYHNTFEFEESQLVIGRVGAYCGCIHITQPKSWITDNALYIKEKKIDYCDMFMFYKLTHINLNKYANQNAQPVISGEKIYPLMIALPPLPEQQRIAEILSTTDAHIEKLDQIIEDYQLLKKGMMKKLLTEGIGHTEFKETEIGRIPKEWDVVELREIASLITKGTTPSTYGYGFIDEGINFIKVENVSSSGEIKISETPKISAECHQKLSRSNIQTEDILISIAGTIGRSAIISEQHLPANTNQALAIVRLDKKFKTSAKYINYTFSSSYFTSYIDSIKTVGAQPNMSLKQLNDNKIGLPCYEEQLEISYILSAFDNRLNLYIEEKYDFIQLKKSLMEKLLTGKIRTTEIQS